MRTEPVRSDLTEERKEERVSLINISAELMEIKRARRTLEQRCQELAEVASQMNEDLDSCHEEIKEIQENLFQLHGVISQDGNTEKQSR